MGQNLCCFRPPATTQNQLTRNNPTTPKETSSLPDHHVTFSGTESTIMTLEDFLILSPALNPRQCIRGGEVSVLKQPNTRVHPSSSPDIDKDNAHFYTPAMSFNSSGKLEKIEEEDEEEKSTKSILSRSGGRSLKKKVSFRLPVEADVIIFYSPEETFGSITDR